MSSRNLLSEQFRREGWDVYEVSSVGNDEPPTYEVRALPGRHFDAKYAAISHGLRFDDPNRPFMVTNWEEWSSVASGILVVTTFVPVNLSEFKGSRTAAEKALEGKCIGVYHHIGGAVQNIVENGMGLQVGDWTSSRFAVEFYSDEYPTNLSKTPF